MSKKPIELRPQKGVPKVMAAVGWNTGCEYWRIFAPFIALQKQGYPCVWRELKAPDFADQAMAADIIVICRVSWLPQDWAMALEWVEMFHKLGKRVVYETDDDLFTDYTERQMNLQAEEKSREQLAQEREDRKFALQLCDGVTVTVPRLQTIVGRYTSAPAVVVPNAIDFDNWRKVYDHGSREWDQLTIGWAGGKRAETDVAPMAEAWGRIARRYPDVGFLVSGYFPENVLAAVPKERLALRNWVPVEQYALGYHGIDIFCCPLADKPFNHNKSCIKAYEAGCMGATVVYSPTVYGREMRDGVHGLQADTADEWEQALSRLIEEAALRQRLSSRWTKTVREEHSLGTQLHRWTDAWEYLAQVPMRQHIVPAGSLPKPNSVLRLIK